MSVFTRIGNPSREWVKEWESLISEIRYTIYQISRKPLMVFGFSIVLLLVIVAIAAPYIVPYDPIAIDLDNRLMPPSSQHWFGTDEVGRDILSRIIMGSRISIQIGVFVIVTAATIGSLVGAASGFIGRKVDTVIMRVMDIILAFPSLVLAMALAAALGPSLLNSMLAIAFVKIPVYARLARGQALSLKEREYVEASRSFGGPNSWIIWKHILPNSLSPIIVQTTMGMGEAIILAASLSFIGLGAQPPVPEWGAMISVGRKYLIEQWWYVTFPGLAIMVVVLGFNIFGDGLRDILDPRLRR